MVLERGRDVKYIKDYPTVTMHPWEFKHGGKMPKAFINENPITSQTRLFDEGSADFFIEDKDLLLNLTHLSHSRIHVIHDKKI